MAEMQRQLIRPDPRFERSYCAYIAELGDEVRYPFPMDFEHRDFDALLLRLEEFRRGVRLPEGFVASSTFWLVEGDELLGVSNLRHQLTDALRESGGHIGLGVRPSARGRGVGIDLLARTLQEARTLGIFEVHIHCHRENLASARMIQRNGGVLASESEGGKAGTLQRYVINNTGD